MLTHSYVLNTILLFTLVSFFLLEYQSNIYKLPDDQKIKITVDKIRYPDKIIREQKLRDIMISHTDLEEDKELVFSGWIPHWAMDQGIKSLRRNAKRFGSVSPVFYEIDKNGEIRSFVSRVEQIREVSIKNSIKIVPTISCFDVDGLSKVLNDIEKINNFIVEEIEKHQFDGIDLNYELIYLSDRDKFFDHLSSLKNELSKRSKLLYVTVLSKWGDEIQYSFAPQTRKVQDYSLIGQYADKVRIMTYDYTSQSSKTPGPISPIDWIEKVLIYSTSKLDPSKISLGINLYGYAWSNSPQALALNYREISFIKNFNKSSETLFSDKYKENIIYYKDKDNNFYFGYYSSPESIRERITLAKKYGVIHFSFWRLGDDPL